MSRQPNRNALSGRVKVKPDFVRHIAQAYERKTLPAAEPCLVVAIGSEEAYLSRSNPAARPPHRSKAMKTRTRQETVTFANPFTLGKLDEVLAAGDYVVETDEELIQGISFPAYRRTLTVIHLPEKAGNTTLTRAMTIDPSQLERARKRDQALAGSTVDAVPNRLDPGD